MDNDVRAADRCADAVAGAQIADCPVDGVRAALLRSAAQHPDIRSGDYQPRYHLPTERAGATCHQHRLGHVFEPRGREVLVVARGLRTGDPVEQRQR